MEFNQMATIVTGVEDIKEEVYERTWNIRNFDLVVANSSLVGAQKFEIKTGHVSGTTCTWLISLEKHPTYTDYIYIICKLIKHRGQHTDQEIEAVFRTYVQLNNEGKHREAEIKHKFHINDGDENVRKNFLMYASEVTKNSLLSSDCSAVINVQLKVLRHAGMLSPRSSGSEQLENEYVKSLRNNMLKLLSDKDSSDVKIITEDDVEFHVHKLILQMQNPVFASMLRSDLSESRTGVVKVNDVCGKTMEIILHYLYTGSLLPSWTNPDVITEFTYAAGKYQLTEILQMLDIALGDKDSEKYSACYGSLLSLASKLSLKSAEGRLLKQIALSTDKVATAQEFFAMIQETNDKQ